MPFYAGKSAGFPIFASMSNVRTLVFDAYGLSIGYPNNGPTSARAIPLGGANISKVRGGLVSINIPGEDGILVDPASLATPSGQTQQQIFDFLREGIAIPGSSGMVLAPVDLTHTHTVHANATGTVVAGAADVTFTNSHASVNCTLGTTPNAITLLPGDRKSYSAIPPYRLPAIPWVSTGSEITIEILKP